MAKKRSKKTKPAMVKNMIYLHVAETLDGRGVIDEIYWEGNGDGTSAGEGVSLREMIENALMFNRNVGGENETKNHIVVAIPLEFAVPKQWEISVPVPVVGKVSGGSAPVTLLRPLL